MISSFLHATVMRTLSQWLTMTAPWTDPMTMSQSAQFRMDALWYGLIKYNRASVQKLRYSGGSMNSIGDPIFLMSIPKDSASLS